MRATAVFILILSLFSSLKAAPRFFSAADSTLLLEGDLAFAVDYASDNHITEVTARGELPPVEHVGIVHVDASGCVTVVEAVPRRGVILSAWRDFTARNPHVMVGRLNDRSRAAESVSRAMSFLGRPYDDLFMLDTNKIYCSELVQVSYCNASGNSLFPLVPMSFLNSDGVIPEFWLDYYHSRGLWVPQGALGSNPASLASSPLLRILSR